MSFELLKLTEATLTSFTGRTETHGKATVPALSFRLRFSGPNTLLDLLSPTARPTFYMAAPGQDDLPGVEPTTPLLRCKDVKTWSPENCYEGWTVTVDYGIDEDAPIEMGGCKVDAFTVELHDNPGMVDVECRVSTSNLDWMGAGRLWSKQRQKLHVMLAAPLTTQTNPDVGQVDERQLTLDGSTGSEMSEPSSARQAAEEVFSGEPERGSDWPFPQAGQGPVAFPNAVDGDDNSQDAGEHLADDVERNGPQHSANPKPKKPSAKKQAKEPGYLYRDALSGQTWSGRGLKPRWLAEALASGKSLSDFHVANASH